MRCFSLKEFARTVRCLPECDEPRVAHHSGERFHVVEAVAGFGSAQGNRAACESTR